MRKIRIVLAVLAGILMTLLQGCVEWLFYRGPIAVLLACSLALAGGCQTITTNGQVDVAKLQAGVAYLENTRVSIETAVTVAKAAYPDKAAVISAQVDPVLDNLRVAIATFKGAVDAQDTGKAVTAWDVARPLVTSALNVAAPYVVGALVGR